MRLPINPLADQIKGELDMGIIKSVSIVSLRRPGSPIVMRIVWDQMSSIRDPRMDQLGVKVSGISRRADAARILILDWQTPDELQEWIEETAWAMGAKDLVRYSKPQSPNGAPDYPGYPVRHFWGVAEYTICGMDDTIGDRIDDAIINEAAQNGWWEWNWINLSGRDKGSSGKIFFKHWLKEDKSLMSDGSRPLPFPGWRDTKLLRLANEFEITQEAGLILRIVYDFEKLKVLNK